MAKKIHEVFNTTMLINNALEHFDQCNTRANFPPPSLHDFFRVVPSTHTLNLSLQTSAGVVHPIANIFSDNIKSSGLLSETERLNKGIQKGSDLRRTMTLARRLALDEYVFSYLGGHEPYYAQSGVNVQPIGLFLSASLDKDPTRCIPSRKDIAALQPNITHAEIQNNFIHAKYARCLAASVAHNLRPNEPDYYYGSPKYYGDPEYIKNTWRNKIEFHFDIRVEPTNIVAMLWPTYTVYHEDLGSNIIEHNEVILNSLKIPERTIRIPYTLDPEDPYLSFTSASISTAKFYVANGEFPNHANIALQAYP